MTVSAPSFVTLSAEGERQATDALAELLVPMLFGRAVQAADPGVPATTASEDA